MNDVVGVFTGIDRSDININPFYAYKKWNVNYGSDTSSVLPLEAIYSDPYSILTRRLPGTFGIPTNINNSLQTITYYSINHLFYKRKNTYHTFGPDDITRVKKFLYQKASIFSFPGTKVGLGIKPESFTYINSTISLKDDRYGNVYDTAINTNSIIDDVMYYEGFNEYFDNNGGFNKYYFDTSRTNNNLYFENVTFVPGITLTGDYVPTTSNIGLAARFNGEGYMRYDKNKLNGKYDRDNNFAISFFISASTQTNDSLIIGKLFLNQDTVYPFKIELTTDAKVKFTAAASSTLKSTVTSSILNSGWQHIVCQKSGSMMYLHVNNDTPISASNPAFIKASGGGNINNDRDLYIGGFDAYSSNITADLDEIRIFNKALSTSNISALNNRTITGSLLQTNVVGNVFHDQGIVVISSPNPIYNNIINTSYSASYRSTVKLNELSVMVRVPSDRYNMSLNKSMVKDDGITYDSFITGSNFSPYITSIGLYDSQNRLLAIAKLAQPIKKRNDVDLNFLIKIDSDHPWTTVLPDPIPDVIDITFPDPNMPTPDPVNPIIPIIPVWPEPGTGSDPGTGFVPGTGSDPGTGFDPGTNPGSTPNDAPVRDITSRRP